MTNLFHHPRRFYLLEVLRAVAILKVVLLHWRFMFEIFGNAHKVPNAQMPLHEIFYLFYLPNPAAVPFFFCISGFIFFWLYSTRVYEKTISLRSFWVNRLSRLYPLHFVTLVITAAGQMVYFRLTDTYLVSQFNDVYHFILNLFLASSWGLEKGFSYNGPVWMLSVMVLLYALFFLFCRLFHRNLPALLAMVLIGAYLLPVYHVFIATGVKYFFFGGILFIVYDRIVKTGDPWKVSVWLPWLTAVFWLATLVFANPHVSFPLSGDPWIMEQIYFGWPVVVLLPATVLSASLLETKKGPIGVKLAFLGDLSFSMYLLHAPLQLIIAIIAVRLHAGPALFYASWFILAYYFILLLLSMASRRFLERPMQNFLRNKFIK